MQNSMNHDFRKSKQTGFITVLCLCVFLFMSGPARGEVVDRIVAVVNDDIISLFELNRVMTPYAEKIREAGYSDEKKGEMLFKVREDILSQLIDQKLTDQEAKRSNISVSEKEIDNAIERVKQAGSYSDEQLREGLKKEGLTLEEYRSRIKEQILRTKLVNVAVKSKIVLTDEEVKKYYEEHIDEYRGDKKYRLRNILLSLPSFAGESEKQEVRKRMEAIVQEFKSGTPFETLAREFSESSMAEEGGYLGEFSFNDISSQLKSALFDLKEGDITRILDTEQGIQVFFIEKIIPEANKSLEKVTIEIEEKLYNEIVNKQFQTWLEELRKRSHIRIIR
ncbi:MAG: SurA N-terminal domain-containing protein [Desulfococcaceae bacterium]